MKSSLLAFWAILPLALSSTIPTSITEVRTDVTTYKEVKSAETRGWSDWFANVLLLRQAPACGDGLLSCDVQDPTRSEAPWHGVAAPFPQCYDPANYVCTSNFLCPIGAPKVEGQYACGPYAGPATQSSSSTSTSSSSSNNNNNLPPSVPSQAPGCRAGLLVCEVQDPTRLEAPWHGVAAPFPQCYDPAAYICSENFLCPINAPKISGQYACGPYIKVSASSQTSSSTPPSTFSTSVLTNPISVSSSPLPSSSTTLRSSSNSIDTLQTPSGTSVLSNWVLTTLSQLSSLSVSSSSSGGSQSVSLSSETSELVSSLRQSSESLLSSVTQSMSLSSTASEILSGGQSSSQSPLSSASQSESSLQSSFTTVSQTVTSSSSSTIGVSSSRGPENSSLSSSPTTILQSQSSDLSSINPLSSSTSTSLSDSSFLSFSTTISQSRSSDISSINSLSSLTSTSLGFNSSVLSSSTSLLQSLSSNLSLSNSLSSQLSTSIGPVLTSIPAEVVIGGSTFPVPTSSATFTAPNGQSFILGPSGIVIGTDTVAFPTGTAPIAVTTDGVTLTFDLASSGTVTPSSISQTSVPEGIIIGGSSFSFPSTPQTLTEPDGQTVILGPSGIIIGSDTISLPTVTAPSAVTTDGLTFTLEPDGSGSSTSSSTPGGILLGGSLFTLPASSETITEPNGGPTVILGPSGIVVGTNTISFPSVTGTATITSDGLTFTLVPALPTASSLSSATSTNMPASTTFSSTDSSGLPIFTAWPPGASFVTNSDGAITSGNATTGTHSDVTTTTQNSDGTPVPAVVHVPKLPCFLCGCWFCPPKIPSFSIVGILGGILPGIYPPPPPGILPPGFSTNLPSITIGPSGDPTYSEEPEEPSSTSSSSTSSSSSSCSTATATDCSVTVSFGIDAQGSTTTSFTTSQCSTVTACSATPFTTTSTISSMAAASTRVVIIPKEGSTADDQNNIRDSIVKDLADPTRLFESRIDSIPNGTMFWIADLNSTKQDELRQLPAVVSVAPPAAANVDDESSSPDVSLDANPSMCLRRRNLQDIEEELPSNFSSASHSLFKRVDNNDAAPPHLRIISQPKQNFDVLSLTQYKYDNIAGRGSTVYVIDSGANPGHLQLRSSGGSVRFEHAGDPTQPGFSKIPGDYDVHGHGSCMTGIVNSPLYGVSKNADLIIVKVMEGTIMNEIDAFTLAYNDIVRIQGTGAPIRPVINFSRGVNAVVVPISDSDKAEIQLLYNIVKKLIGIGAIVVTAAGNDGATFRNEVQRKRIDSWPAVFNSRAPTEWGVQLPIIVVGATNYQGLELAASQNGDALTVGALGADLDCPWREGIDDINRSYPGPENPSAKPWGTSGATAAVSGLVAYFWSLPQIGQYIDNSPKTDVDNPQTRMKLVIQQNAYVRTYLTADGGTALGTLPVVWNGKESQWNGPARKPKRQMAGNGGGCYESIPPFSTTLDLSTTEVSSSQTSTSAVPSSTEVSSTSPTSSSEPSSSSGLSSTTALPSSSTGMSSTSPMSTIESTSPTGPVSITQTCATPITTSTCIGSGEMASCSAITTCPPNSDTSLPTDLPTLTSKPSSTPPPTSTTSAPAPTKTNHCVKFSFEASSEFDTVWSADINDNGVQVCRVQLPPNKSNKPTFKCGNGISVRVDDSNPRLNYLKTWYTTPDSDGERYFEVPVESDQTQNCGTGPAPLQCRITNWASPPGPCTF